MQEKVISENMVNDLEVISNGSDIEEDADEEQMNTWDFVIVVTWSQAVAQYLEFLEEKEVEEGFEGIGVEWTLDNF